jgi:hypothetical protein
MPRKTHQHRDGDHGGRRMICPVVAVLMEEAYKHDAMWKFEALKKLIKSRS